MKFFRLMILAFSITGFSQNAFADNSEKIAVVKKVYETFDAQNSDDWINYLGTTSLKASLKKSLNYGAWFNKKYEGEFSSCDETTAHPPYPGNGGVEKGEDLSVKYFESSDGMIIAQLKMDNEANNYHTEDFMAYKVVLENGSYKIDDISYYAYEENKAKWVTGRSYKDSVKEYCNIAEVKL